MCGALCVATLFTIFFCPFGPVLTSMQRSAHKANAHWEGMF